MRAGGHVNQMFYAILIDSFPARVFRLNIRWGSRSESYRYQLEKIVDSIDVEWLVPVEGKSASREEADQAWPRTI